MPPHKARDISCDIKLINELVCYNRNVVAHKMDEFGCFEEVIILPVSGVLAIV